MNIYCKSALHQLEVAVSTIVEIINILDENDLQKRPTADKYSIGELLEHVVLICKADFLISTEATKDEMTIFYSKHSFPSLTVIKEELLTNFIYLKTAYAKMGEMELHQETTSYWGVTYTRFEWLLEMVAHMYHHRGQLHAMLVHCIEKDPRILMFE